MGKIVGINNMIIVAENGPIRFLVGESNINRDNIQFKKSAYYPVTSTGELINRPISKGTYVMIQVMNKKIVKGKTKIIVFGRLESVVLDDNIMDAIRNQYESSENVNAEDLINNRLEKREMGETQESRDTNVTPEDTGSDTLESADD